MNDKLSQPVLSPYPHWEAHITVIIRRGVTISLNWEGTGYELFKDTIHEFLLQIEKNTYNARIP